MIFTVFALTRQQLPENQYHCKLFCCQRNSHLTFYVLIFMFEDFDLATKRPLAIDVNICLNHQKLPLWLASLSAGSKY